MKIRGILLFCSVWVQTLGLAQARQGLCHQPTQPASGLGIRGGNEKTHDLHKMKESLATWSQNDVHSWTPEWENVLQL